MPQETLTRAPTAHVHAELLVSGPGDREYMIESAYLGEDVPLIARFRNPDDTGADPDDQNADAVPDANLTVTAPDGTTEVLTSVAMTHQATGEFEYVWDTAVNGAGIGEYTVEVTAEFSAETKIGRDTIELR